MSLSGYRNSPHRRQLVMAVLFLFLGNSLLSGCADDSSSTLSGPAINVCKGKPDTDKDGVCDQLENQVGTNPNNPNSDAPIDPFPDGTDFDPNGVGIVGI